MHILYFIVCYLIGCMMTAYLIGKWKGIDLRQQHSGNLGARNAGRTLGKSFFIVTVLGDAGKGALVILIGRYLQLDDQWIAFGILLVVIGHIYPFWLSFKGGKGIATGIGSLLIFSPVYSLAFLVGFLVMLPVLRSTTLSMMVGFFSYSAFLIWMERYDLWPFFLMLALIAWKHRTNIAARLGFQ